MSAVIQPQSDQDYVVADISLADFGRKEIAIAAVSYTHLTLPTKRIV